VRATHGRVGGRLGRRRFLLLHHVGARSGRPRVTPLLYHRDGPRLVVVASKGGGARHPAWLHNLRAHPDVEVELPGEGRRWVRVRAREADDAERARLWPVMVGDWPWYDSYQRSTRRPIALVLLEPPPAA
jgi:F420H(2)-dependent quinone reductase